MAGTAGLQDAIVIAYEITGDATGGDDYVLPRGGTIADIWAVASATSGGGTATVAVGGNAVSSAVVLAVADAVSRTTTLDVTFTTVVTGDTLTFTTNGAADRGTVFVLLVPPVSDSTAIA